LQKTLQKMDRLAGWVTYYFRSRRRRSRLTPRRLANDGRRRVSKVDGGDENIAFVVAAR